VRGPLCSVSCVSRRAACEAQHSSWTAMLPPAPSDPRLCERKKEKLNICSHSLVYGYIPLHAPTIWTTIILIPDGLSVWMWTLCALSHAVGTGGRTLLVPGRRAHQQVGSQRTPPSLVWDHTLEPRRRRKQQREKHCGRFMTAIADLQKIYIYKAHVRYPGLVRV